MLATSEQENYKTFGYLKYIYYNNVMFKKFKTIASAWIEAENPSPESKALAERRAAVCNGCEFRKKNTTLIDFYYCGLCGCPLSKKIFSPVDPETNPCPEKKWDK